MTAVDTQPGAGVGGSNGAAQLSGNGWMQKAIANCYFHSPLPALTRPLRDRYQLAMPQGRWPRPSFEKRTEPSARILYYHRVNDDNDLFFPAMSTALFGHEMR